LFALSQLAFSANVLNLAMTSRLFSTKILGSQLKLAALWIVLSRIFGARSRVHWFKSQFSRQDILNCILSHGVRLSALGICYGISVTNTVKMKNIDHISIQTPK
jgi:hypothetical protein